MWALFTCFYFFTTTQNSGCQNELTPNPLELDLVILEKRREILLVMK